MDTDDLENRLLDRCHRWMHNKPVELGVFGPVQATARVFLVQALSAWTGMESAGAARQLAPDVETWLQKIIADELPVVRARLEVKVSIPKH
jgi:hypothetical protein